MDNDGRLQHEAWKLANNTSLPMWWMICASQGVAGLGSARGFYAGPLFVVAEGGDMSGIVIGARTGSEGGGGSYSVFYNAVPFGEAFSREAWVEGAAAEPGEPQQPGAGQHRGGGQKPERLPS